VSSERNQRLNETVAALQDRWGSTAVRRLGQVLSGPVPHIPTGFPALDKALGIGGLPIGRISELVGSPTSGMASIALTLASRAQDQAGTVVYIDVGHNFDPDFAAHCGVELNRLMLVRPGDVFQALHILQDFVASDGIGALVFDADQSLFSDPQPAKTLATTLDRIIAPLSQTACLLLFLTSLRSLSSSASRPPPTDFPHTSLIPHHSAVRLFIQREKWLYKQGDISGYRAHITVVKNKLGPSGKQVSVSIEFAETVSVKALSTTGEDAVLSMKGSNGSSNDGGGS
jgi:recombination protein RecA